MMISHIFRRIALAHDLLPAEATATAPSAWTAQPPVETRSQPAEPPSRPWVAAELAD